MTNSMGEQWQRVRQLTAANDIAAARAIVEAMLGHDPADVTARLYLAGLLGAEDHQRAAVAQTLEAARHPPQQPQLLGDLVAALIWSGELVAARHFLDSPLLTMSTTPPVLMRAAGQRQAIGEHRTALALMQRARAFGAGGSAFLFHHAVQLGFNGEVNAARRELEQCVALDPPIGGAFVELARMAKATPERNHVGQIERALGRVQPNGLDHAALQFALFEELHALERHDEAWSTLERGNAIMHHRLPYDGVREAELLQAMAELDTSAFARKRPSAANVGPQPIFVIGLPRSGTTLLERMLGGHSLVTSAGELGDFPRSLSLACDHLPRGMFDHLTLSRLPHLDWAAVGRTYLSQTRWRAAGKPFFVDKLPRNWMVAGLIHLALPDARILHITRDPMDVAFSNWRAFFGPEPAYSYAYDIEALASHYASYCKLMTHWYATSPGRILHVDYRALVGETEATLRTITDFCGLPHEPGCADPGRNTTPSATLSMAQVRRGVRTDTFQAWQPYSEQLAGLREALASVGSPGVSARGTPPS